MLKTPNQPVLSPEELVNSTVGPNQKKIFINVSDQIPNFVYIKNLDPVKQANFIMTGNPSNPSWSLFIVLDPGQTVSYGIDWGEAQFENQGLFDSSIAVYGNGIFPKQ